MMNNGDKIKVICEIPIFEDLKGKSQALETISSSLTQRSFPVGSLILEEGVVGEEFYILTSGKVQVLKKTIEGEPYVVAVMNADKHPIAFGEGGLLDGEARTATIKALAPCETLVLSGDSFKKFAVEQPNWALPVLMKLIKRVMGKLKQSNHDLSLLYSALVSEIRNG